jgi:hypothetical protein
MRLLKKRLDKFFGGWYRIGTLEFSNFVEVAFHKSSGKEVKILRVMQ